ncbi:MAG: Holliday junction resolvase RuvX [Planctomycetes bacterium]|nr:Holliday junction resolvase RuvX [Planctomycetota bacterium]
MTLPRQGRLAGIDYGEKRIGVAICDGDQRIAGPLEIRHRQSESADETYFRRLAQDYDLAGFVVGLPVHASGDESAKSQECRRFGAWLSEITGLPVAFFDERYTSAQADTLMAGHGLTRRQKKDRRDMLAAQVILAAYLESSSAEESPGALEDEDFP